jgi:tetratricopeptide (TPR) repeat protein
MPSITGSRAGLILVAAVALAYGPSLRNGFVFDDAMFVRDDPRVHTLGEAPRFFIEPLWGYLDADGVRHLHQYYRPLQTFPLAVLRATFGDRAWPAHLLNVALHAANALLTFSIFAVILGNTAPALLLSLLWALHPAYSEAVLWISNLAGLGAALATLGLLRLHLAAVGNLRPALMSALLFTGLLFHEIAIIAPLLLVAYELIAIRPPRWRRLALELVACLPAVLLYVSLRVRALGAVVPGIGNNPMTAVELFVNGIGLLPQYVRTFVWPFGLNMYHDFSPVSGMGDSAVVAGAALAIAIIAAFAVTLRRARAAAFAFAWIAMTTLPYLLIRWPQLNVFAERYLYLPSAGVFLLAGVALARNRRSGRDGTRGVVAAVVVLSILGIGVIWRRIPDWRDDLTLYTKTLTQSDRAVLIRNNLAVRLLEQNRYEEGIRVLEDVADTPAATSDTWHNLGLLRAAVGDDRGALRAFRRASRHGVPKLSTVLNLGYMYDRVGERRDAVETYMRLLDRAPDYVPAWFNLAMIAFDSGQYENAGVATSRVLALSPDDRQAQQLQRRLQQLSAKGTGSQLAEVEATKRSCRQAMRDARRGHYREAMIALRAAAWLDERAALPHQYMANVAALRRDWKTALAESRSALGRSPGNPLYRRNVEALERKLATGTPAR